MLKSCKGRVCIDPWRELHPAGDVSSLKDSLNADFDGFYESQDRVSFSDCKLGYLPEFEGPMAAKQFRAAGANEEWHPEELKKRDYAIGYRNRHNWSAWS